MQVRLNGKQREVAEGISVAGLVAELGYGARQVVVELNGEALERDRFEEVVLRSGDVVEVVRAVAGGAQPVKALRDTRLYLVAPGDFGPLDQVIEAGVDVVQLRMKVAPVTEVLAAGERFKQACARGGVPFIVNDRPDVALALGADGVHLGQDDLPPAVARAILGPGAIIGRSTHSVADIEHALAEHADGVCDYFAVGPVHETPTGPGKPAVGTELVAHAAEVAGGCPWFAIGGLDAGNVGEVIEAGAQRICVVRAITLASDPVAATTDLLATMS